ncbi:MAG TPA: SCO family protein [Bradyrhizobium sp.]|nr:SCO family protein [Bradyrhizobium sp.]
MRSAVFLLSFTISFLPWPVGVSAHDHDHMSHLMKAAEPLPGASIYNLTSSWTNQDGKRVTLESLRGEPVVVAMGYTRCKDICPMIVADMVAIEDRAKEASLKGIRFAFFSLDSINDTPERLTAYANDHGLEPAHWTLFQGDEKAVRELAAVLGVRYRRDASGGFDHSAIITILDADGKIVVQQPDVQANTEEMVKKLTTLFDAPVR